MTRLTVSDSAAQSLHDVTDAWRSACAIATDFAWPETTSASAIQSAAYDRIREETGLKSQHTLLVCHHVAETVRSLAARAEQGQSVSKPSFDAPTATYDSKTLTLSGDGSVSLTTLGTRVHDDLALPSNADGYQYQYLTDNRWNLTESTLTYRDGAFYLHLGFRRPRPDRQLPEHRTVLGVDLGIDHLAVTSTGRFFSGVEFNHYRREIQERERALQQVGTRSAYRTLTQIHHRRRRRARDRLHRVANGIIEEAITHDATVIALENLTGIRDRLPETTAVHRWEFRTLAAFIKYRARARGINVVRVSPAHTSTRCSRTDCGHTTSANRPSRAQFRCVECGYEVHADYNAAKNVGLRCVRRGHMSSRRTGTGQCALKSGTLSPSDGFTDKLSTG
ncbi:RNA-guided endonuclease InsQ/TnpB family protein [Halosegnis sp.]|uniref:RNA-guided endonuclease InsQ/TnpB family protein n=1 Tax=Halosegnis sp. TaxID=2864959 RepID=UPI0035D514B3